MKIVKLYDHIEMAGIVARFVYDEFASKSKSNISFDEVLDFFKKTNKDKLPMTYVAIENDECIGSASLFKSDLKMRMDLAPWLASLVVRNDFRNRGIGEKLIRHVINEARSLGYVKIYLKTENKSGYYRKRGWKHIGKGTDQYNQESDLFEYDLQIKSGNHRSEPNAQKA